MSGEACCFGKIQELFGGFNRRPSGAVTGYAVLCLLWFVICLLLRLSAFLHDNGAEFLKHVVTNDLETPFLVSLSHVKIVFP